MIHLSLTCTLFITYYYNNMLCNHKLNNFLASLNSFEGIKEVHILILVVVLFGLDLMLVLLIHVQYCTLSLDTLILVLQLADAELLEESLLKFLPRRATGAELEQFVVIIYSPLVVANCLLFGFNHQVVVLLTLSLRFRSNYF